MGRPVRNSGTIWGLWLAPNTMSQFCSLLSVSTELSLDICIRFSRLEHSLGMISHVFGGITAPGLLCIPLDFRSFTMKLLFSLHIHCVLNGRNRDCVIIITIHMLQRKSQILLVRITANKNGLLFQRRVSCLLGTLCDLALHVVIKIQ